MADELKPCPFCGDDGIVRQCGGRDRKLVQCDICGISHFSWQDRPIEYSLLARAEAAEQKNKELDGHIVDLLDKIHDIQQEREDATAIAEAASSQLRAAVDAFEEAEGKMAWRPIETAPKDGTEILAWRDDCGVVIAAWTCQREIMTDAEIEEHDLGDSADDCDWFSAYGFGCDWMSGTEAPTHWMPMPSGPALDAILAPDTSGEKGES